VTVVLALAGLFGYYYLTDSSGRSGQERAKDAGLHVLDTAKDTAAGGAIKTRLTAALGMDASRLLHVWYDDGKVLIYGLAPAGVDEPRIRGLLSDVPGLSSVEILIQPRPDYVTAALSGGGAPPATGGQSAEKKAP
jgi:hypothetical protein